MDQELDSFKTDINLAEYAASKGYKLNTKKSGKNHKVMHTVDSKNRPLDTVLIKQYTNTGQYYYSNPNNFNDKGSIVDFIQNREDKNLGQVRKELRAFSGSPAPKIPELEIKKSTFKKEDMMAEFHKLQPLNDREFLHGKGLTDDTLNSKTFQGTAFNNKVELYGKEYTNTAFPVYNTNELVGIEQKNANYKGSMEGSEIAEGLWVSNVDKSKPIDNIHVMESPIDAMSHYQLNPNKGKTNDIYFATNGPLTNQQSELLNQVVKDQQPKTVNLSFDNDPAGYRFSIKGLNDLEVSDQHKFSNNYNTKYPAIANADVKAGKLDKQTGFIEFTLGAKDKDESIYNATQLRDSFEKFNKENYNKTVEGSPFKVKTKDISENFSKVTVEFKNLKDNWKVATDYVGDIKRNDIVERNMSKTKDWNDDLKESLGSNKKSSKDLKEPKSVVKSKQEKVKKIETPKIKMGKGLRR